MNKNNQYHINGVNVGAHTLQFYLKDYTHLKDWTQL